MTNKPIPRLGAAMALVELLQERSDLPPAVWTLDSVNPSLHGYLHEGSMEALRVYASALGGSVRPGQDYEYKGQMVRLHRLHTLWRDIRVMVAVVLPAPVAVTA